MKYELDTPGIDEDSLLFGISCHERVYRLCWAMNKELGIGLARDPEGLELTVPGSEENEEAVNFPLYTYYDEEDHVNYSLVENHSEGRSLIPERREIDRFFLIQAEEKIVELDPREALRKIGPVLAVFRIEPGSMKRVANLLI